MSLLTIRSPTGRNPNDPTSFHIATEYFIYHTAYYSSFYSSHLVKISFAVPSSDGSSLYTLLFCFTPRFQTDLVYFLCCRSHRTMYDLSLPSLFGCYSFIFYPRPFLRFFKPGLQIIHRPVTIHWLHLPRITFRGHCIKLLNFESFCTSWHLPLSRNQNLRQKYTLLMHLNAKQWKNITYINLLVTSCSTNSSIFWLHLPAVVLE